jgi:uncharacterized protein YndB with AHSA1/START domain
MSPHGPPIVQERLLPAPPDVVFAAWSDPDSLAVWMCPGEMRGATVEVDFRVGGRFRIAMHGAEQEFVQHGEYLEISPGKRLAFTWVSEWVDEPERHTRVSVSFEPGGEGETLLRLVHEELPVTETYDGHREGWASILEKLADHLARPASGGTA